MTKCLLMFLFAILLQNSARTQSIEPIQGSIELWNYVSGYDISVIADSQSNNMQFELPEYAGYGDLAGFVVHGIPGSIYQAKFILRSTLMASSNEPHCAPESVRFTFDAKNGYQSSAHLYFNPTDSFSFVMNAAGIDTIIVGFKASLSQSIWEMHDDYTIGIDLIEEVSSVEVHDSTFYEFSITPYGDFGIDGDMDLEGLARGHTYTLSPEASKAESVSPKLTGVEEGESGKVSYYTGCGREEMLVSFILPKALYKNWTGMYSHGDSIPCKFSDQSLYLKEINEYRNPKMQDSVITVRTPWVQLAVGTTVDVPGSLPTGEYEGEVIVFAEYTGLKNSSDHHSRIMQIPQPIHIYAHVVESNSPESMTLLPNFPNPFNGSTSIRYFLPASGEVDLSVYNLLGQRLTTLVHDRVSEGFHTATWEGSGYASGIYICRMSSGDQFATQRIVVVR